MPKRRGTGGFEGWDGGRLFDECLPHGGGDGQRLRITVESVGGTTWHEGGRRRGGATAAYFRLLAGAGWSFGRRKEGRQSPMGARPWCWTMRWKNRSQAPQSLIYCPHPFASASEQGAIRILLPAGRCGRWWWWKASAGEQTGGGRDERIKWPKPMGGEDLSGGGASQMACRLDKVFAGAAKRMGWLRAWLRPSLDERESRVDIQPATYCRTWDSGSAAAAWPGFPAREEAVHSRNSSPTALAATTALPMPSGEGQRRWLLSARRERREWKPPLSHWHTKPVGREGRRRGRVHDRG